MGAYDRIWMAVDVNGGELDARIVPCTSCRARAGVYCRRPSGHKAADAHIERWHAAAELVLERAPVGHQLEIPTAGDDNVHVAGRRVWNAW